jgi:hypothetical protein
VVAVAYSIKEVESYLRAILQWQLTHNFLSEIQRGPIEVLCAACACCWMIACAGCAYALHSRLHVHIVEQPEIEHAACLMPRRSGGGDGHPPAGGG